MNSCVGFSAYAITHRATGKTYIGITTRCVTLRFREHTYRSACGLLTDAVRRYGAQAFFARKLGEAVSWEQLRYLETELIVQYDTFGSGGYNRSWRTDPESMDSLAASENLQMWRKSRDDLRAANFCECHLPRRAQQLSVEVSP